MRFLIKVVAFYFVYRYVYMLASNYTERAYMSFGKAVWKPDRICSPSCSNDTSRKTRNPTCFFWGEGDYSLSGKSIVNVCVIPWVITHYSTERSFIYKMKCIDYVVCHYYRAIESEILLVHHGRRQKYYTISPSTLSEE